MNNLKIQVSGYKKGEKECLIQILDIIKPLLNKYARHLYNIEFEDAKEELLLAVLESLEKMQYMNTDAECLCYLKNAIRNRYLELSRKSLKRKENEIYLDEYSSNDSIMGMNMEENVEMKLLLISILKCYPKKKILIFYESFIYERSDKDIAQQFHISRQYVHRVKKECLNTIYTLGYKNNTKNRDLCKEKV